jgi:hypothetical protein
MALDSELPQVDRSEKLLFGAKAFLWSFLIVLLVLTVGGTWAVVYRIDKANDRLLDCIVPSGKCYQGKVDDVNRNRYAEVNIVVRWCADTHNYKEVQELRECVAEELRKLK